MYILYPIDNVHPQPSSQNKFVYYIAYIGSEIVNCSIPRYLFISTYTVHYITFFLLPIKIQ